MALSFWLSITVLAYVYIGYPALVWLVARIRRPREMPGSESELSVAVVIAAYNEAQFIEETVRNKLNAHYPASRLTVWVVSDESSDGTDDIVSALGDRVRLIRQSPRAGKTQALNTAITQIDADLIVFSDANSLYEPFAIGHLVSRFSDPGVGYVTGKMVYASADGTVSGS